MSDGGVATKNVEGLATFDQFESVRNVLVDPFRTVREKPVAVFYLTIPLIILSVLVRLDPQVAAGTVTLAAADDEMAQAALFVLTTFAVVRELKRRRLTAIEGFRTCSTGSLVSTRRG